LVDAYRKKGIQELYSHQTATAELVRNGKNVVVVTPTAYSANRKQLWRFYFGNEEMEVTSIFHSKIELHMAAKPR
jgi:hypothetical protein